jgi:KDO2-lipid IV(A) lauroyltransferase
MSDFLSVSDKFKLSPLWVISLLPLRLFYGLAEFLFLVLYYLIGYRKKVVFENLLKSFPEKSNSEINSLTRRLYRYMCDNIIESIFLINMSQEECNRWYQHRNIELLDKLADEKRNIILATIHYGNWEWANNLNNFCHYKILGIYKLLSNKLFNRLFCQIRGKYVSKLLSMKHTFSEALDSIKNEKLFALYLVADQRNEGEDLKFRTTFFNQEAPVITGMKKICRKFNLAIVYMLVHPVRRGYYQIIFELLIDKTEEYVKFAIAEKYIRKVEEQVKEQPGYYLWSNMRRKYRPEELNLRAI